MYKWNRQESIHAGNVNGSPARSKTEYLTIQEHVAALQSARQEHNSEVMRLQSDFRQRLCQLEETIASLTKEVSILKSRPTPEPPPYVMNSLFIVLT